MKFGGLEIFTASSAKNQPIPEPDVAEETQKMQDSSVETMLGSMERHVIAGNCAAGLHGGKGKTLSGFQKFRRNWAALPLKEQIELCREQTASNWFASMIHETRLAVHVYGLTFKGKKAKRLAGFKGKSKKDRYKAGTMAAYPWEEVVKDIFSDYLAVQNVIALWRKGQDKLPHISVLNAEDCEYKAIHGMRKITLRYTSDYKLNDTPEKTARGVAQFGQEMFTAMVEGGEIEIEQGQHSDWEFEVLTSGKRKEELSTPAMVPILDDLDFIEMLKIGDWNGAYTRKDILRIATKGHGIKSGSNAGRGVGNAKKKHLTQLMTSLKSAMGLSNFAVNWDTDFKHEFLSSEFFGEHRSKDALKRLIAWGGLEAALLMDGFSQVSGVSPYMARLWRPAVLLCREEVAEFCARIFNNPSFRSEGSDVLLVPEFSKGILYNTEELTRLGEHLLANGAISIDTFREMHDVDPAKEKKRIEKSHKHPEQNTPVHEPKQGLVKELRNPDDDSGGDDKSKKPAVGSTEKGGRPANV